MDEDSDDSDSDDLREDVPPMMTEGLVQFYQDRARRGRVPR